MRKLQPQVLPVRQAALENEIGLY